jgi:hypothetical protein
MVSLLTPGLPLFSSPLTQDNLALARRHAYSMPYHSRQARLHRQTQMKICAYAPASFGGERSGGLVSALTMLGSGSEAITHLFRDS